ncbi:MAG: TlpA family protein disulfide reductase [Solirubrobacterales bacterium]
MSKSRHTPFRPLFAGVLAVLCGLLIVACGQGDSSETGSPPPDYAKKLAGSPPPLAALHKQGNEILEGGEPAFDSRLGELRGFPAVVNVWASWCGPCRAEFPHFQQAAANLGTEVAFLGVDSDDDTPSAETFLGENPVPYPSFSDPDQEIGNSLGATHGIPATAFFDSDGKQTFTKFGPYANQEDLEADIQTYAIDGG